MRLDFVFSYWIFAWYLCYAFKWTRYNPKVALLVGLLENGVVALLMLYYNPTLLPYFVMVNTVIKVLPYWSIQRKMQWVDLYPTVGLFVVYLVWLKWNNQSYKEMLQGILNGDSVFPMSTWLRNNIRRIYVFKTPQTDETQTGA
jgi:hypothetical protein